MQTVYNYHPETGAFLGTNDADESPLEPGVFLLPAHATFIAPPKNVPAGKVAAFSLAKEKWELRAAPAPAGDSPAPGTEPAAPTLEQLRAALQAHLAAASTLMEQIDAKLGE